MLNSTTNPVDVNHAVCLINKNIGVCCGDRGIAELDMELKHVNDFFSENVSVA